MVTEGNNDREAADRIAALEAEVAALRALPTITADPLGAEWMRREAASYVRSNCWGSEAHAAAILAIPAPTPEQLLADAAETLFDMLHMRGELWKSLDRDFVQTLWDDVKREGGYAAVSAFLTALAALPNSEKGGA